MRVGGTERDVGLARTRVPALTEPQARLPVGAAQAGDGRPPQAGMLIGLTALGAAALAFIEPLLPLHLADLALQSGRIGLVFGATAIAGAAAAPLAGFLAGKLPPLRVAAVGTLVVLAGFALAGRPIAWIGIVGCCSSARDRR
jgi:MFS family permease